MSTDGSANDAVPPAARDAVPPAARDAVPPAARDAVPPAARDAVPGGERYRLLIVGSSPAAVCAADEAARRGVRAAWVRPAQDGVGTSPAACADALPAPPEGVDVHVGQAVFLSDRTLAVDGRELSFRRAVIATGARWTSGDVDGAEQSGCLLPDRLDALTERPARLAVIGCGPVACRSAQAWQRGGSQVHLVDRGRTILPDEEPDAAELIGARMQQDGVRLHLGCRELAIETTGNLRAVVLDTGGGKEKLLVDEVAVCGPRRPNTGQLGLEAAGVIYTDDGVVIGDRLQTTARRIYSAGAVCGRPFASPQAAEATARLAVHNALGHFPRKLSRLVAAECIRTEPQLARAGLTRAEAEAADVEIRTHRIELADADASLPECCREGFVLVHLHAQTGRIVGTTAVAGHADELIAPLVLLMTQRRPLTALARMVACRPSRAQLLVDLAARCAAARPPVWSRWTAALRKRLRKTFGGDV